MTRPPRNALLLIDVEPDDRIMGDRNTWAGTFEAMAHLDGVRAEVLKDNLQQVDDYFRQFIRERGVQSIVYVDKAGRVAVATDRKLEGQAASGFVAAGLLDATEPTFEETPPSLRLAIPVMGFDARVGVLILDYNIQGKKPQS